MTDATDHTFVTRFRIPRRMWDAYGTAAARQGVDRSADLVDHVRDFIRQHGTADELAELAAAEEELAARRARKGGRPKKETTAYGTMLQRAMSRPDAERRARWIARGGDPKDWPIEPERPDEEPST